MNGNWLATGSTDGFTKLYDIRTMKEFEAWRVNNGEDSVSWGYFIIDITVTLTVSTGVQTGLASDSRKFVSFRIF
jgi:WD40 repeat protein